MYLLSPCSEEDELLIFNPDQIVYKGFPTGASVAPLDVTRVRWLEMEGDRIPICVVNGSDWNCERTQMLAKTFAVNSKEVDKVVQEIDTFHYLKERQSNVTLRSELSDAYNTIAELEKSIDDRVASKLRHARSVDKEPMKIPSMFKGKWMIFWAGIFIISVALFTKTIGAW